MEIDEQVGEGNEEKASCGWPVLIKLQEKEGLKLAAQRNVAGSAELNYMTMQVYIWDAEFEFMTTLNYLQKCWQQKDGSSS